MDVWIYEIEVSAPLNVSGWDVAARDGDIGKIDEATYENRRGCLIVDTGWWIFGKKRMIPAGTVTTIDPDDRKVHVALTKDDIKNAPDYDEQRRDNDDFRREHEDYYARYATGR